jgi:hypothetical protein
MDNVITYKTQTIQAVSDPKRSMVNIPVDEDWSMVVVVTAVNGNIISGRKIWDLSTEPFIFFATNLTPGIVPKVGESTIFYPTGS